VSSPETWAPPAPAPTSSTAGLTASGTVITFRGFLAAYEEGRDAERYQDDAGAAAKDSKDVRLPAIAVGDGGHRGRVR